MNLRFQAAACFVVILCGCCALCRAEQVAPPPGSDFPQTSVEAVNSPIYPGEPLGLRLIWHNASQQSIEFPVSRVFRIYLAAEGQPPLLFRLPNRFPLSRIAFKPVTLAPEKSYEQVLLITAGSVEGEGHIRFILDKAGTYRVWPDGFDPKTAATVKVEDPPDAERAARELWTLPVADFALGYYYKPRQDVIDAIDEIINAYPESRYAPYAAYGKAVFLFGRPKGNGPPKDLKDVIKLLEFIVDQHPKASIRKDAMRVLSIVYRTSEDAERVASFASKRHMLSKWIGAAAVILVGSAVLVWLLWRRRKAKKAAMAKEGREG